MDWNGGMDYGIFVYTDGTLCSTIDNYKLEVCNIYGSSPFPLFETSEGFLYCRKGYNSYA